MEEKIKYCRVCQILLKLGENITLCRYADSQYICNICQQHKQKMWRVNNPHYNKHYCSEWYSQNKQYCSEYQKNRRDVINARERERRRQEPNFKMARNLRCRLSRILNGKVKHGSSIGDLGCDINHLKVYIESLFELGMSWDNYGEWHLDHIIPLSSFDLTIREQFLKAVHYTNLQPLWAKENIAKGAKLEWKKNNT